MIAKVHLPNAGEFNLVVEDDSYGARKFLELIKTRLRYDNYKIDIVDDTAPVELDGLECYDGIQYTQLECW